MSEADIQAEFYHHARLAGVTVTLEYVTPVGRLDIAVLSHDRTRLLAIVECKKAREYMNTQSMQMMRYRSIGVPVLTLTHFDEAKKVLINVVSHLRSEGVALAKVQAMARPIRSPNRKPRIRFKGPEFDECLNVKERAAW
jgi:hypothetical protein